MDRMVIWGFDPGATGASARLTFEHGIVTKLDLWPNSYTKKCHGRPRFDMIRLGSILRENMDETDYAFIERVGARPGQGVVGMFSFGLATGAVMGQVELVQGKPINVILPIQWKNYLGLIKQPKEATIQYMIDRFGDMWPEDMREMTLTCKAGAISSACADACAIALGGKVMLERGKVPV